MSSQIFLYNTPTMKSFLTLIALVAIALVAFFVWRSTPSGYVFTPYESTTLRE